MVPRARGRTSRLNASIKHANRRATQSERERQPRGASVSWLAVTVARALLRAAVALLCLLVVAPAPADAPVLRLSFAKTRSQALLRTIVKRQHADGGRITSCYRVSDQAARCGLKTWRSSGGARWTCYGHINNFFAPAGSNRVSTQSRGVRCR